MGWGRKFRGITKRARSAVAVAGPIIAIAATATGVGAVAAPGILALSAAAKPGGGGFTPKSLIAGLAGGLKPPIPGKGGLLPGAPGPSIPGVNARPDRPPGFFARLRGRFGRRR